MSDQHHEHYYRGLDRCPVCLRWAKPDTITYQCAVCGVDCCDECVPGHQGSHLDSVPLCVLAEAPEAQQGYGEHWMAEEIERRRERLGRSA